MRPGLVEKVKLEHRRTEVAARYLAGETQWEIARAMGVHQCQISRDMKRLRADWTARREASFDEAQAEHIARLEQTLHEAWAAFQTSKQPREVKTASTDPEGRKTYTVRTETHAPSAALLGEIRAILAEVARICGFYAPIKQDVKLYDFSNLSDAEFRGLLFEEFEGVIREAEGITCGAAGTEEGAGSGS